MNANKVLSLSLKRPILLIKLNLTSSVVLRKPVKDSIKRVINFDFFDDKRSRDWS